MTLEITYTDGFKETFINVSAFYPIGESYYFKSNDTEYLKIKSGVSNYKMINE